MEQTPNPRRRLLRGSLAAPVVLTVASPGALAQASFYACIQRSANNQTPTDLYAMAQDGWYRKAFDAFSFRLSDTAPEYSYCRMPSGKDKSTWLYSYYRMDICDTNPIPEADVSAINKNPLGKRYALVWVDSTGKNIGYGMCRPTDGYAVSVSCWASFDKYRTL